ncbi:AAA family ATPase [Geodermatophilus sp. SYSU D00710]
MRVAVRGTVGELLATRRRHRFVGRRAELELVRSALEVAQQPFSVLHVHGPGGIGKTSLLETVAEVAAEAGCTVVRIDGRSVGPSASAVSDALAGEIEVPPAPASVPSPPGRLVLLIDGYEHLAPLDGWFRDELLPRLPRSSLTVLAGRTPPGAEWRADPAWHELMRSVSLRNLDSTDSRSYLTARGIEPALHRRIVEVSHGHPLGLSLLADLVAAGGELGVDPLTPDLVATLLHQLVDTVPSVLHRRALEVCSLARTTTEPLLRDALVLEDAHELFGWLRSLSFVEQGPDGLFPHDLARDALDADLRWRDLDGYKQTFRAVRRHVHERMRASSWHTQQRAAFDEKFLFRHLPGVLSPVDWGSWGQTYPEPARDGDAAVILELVELWEGQESAAMAAHWLARQAEGFFVLRATDGGLRGVVGLLDLTRASAEDRAVDPVARAAWEYAHRTVPPRPGEVVTLTRFVVDRQAHQGPSPTLNAVPVLTLQRYVSTPELAWDLLSLIEPDRWDDYFAVADMPRAAGADVVVTGRRHGLFAHDFRAVPVDSWMELVTERALAADFALAPSSADPQPVVFSQEEFEVHVRQALRDLSRADLLARNPLLRARLVQADGGNTAALAALVREAAASLTVDPRDDRAWRAVDRTYLRPCGTQEAAAAVLGLPFSTYRRHLAQGVSRIVSWLWEREVYGPR